jgi:cytosine/adenosine deaminase-related metal-dependent hydrolase
MYIGSGIAPIPEYLKAGVNVALGTDGPASNNSLDMLREAKTGLLLQRHSYWDTRVKARHLLEAATRGGARAMGLDRAGAIEPGAPADIAVLDLSRPWSLPLRLDNLASAILYAATGSDTIYTIVAGNPVYTLENRDRLWSLAEQSAQELNMFLEDIGPGRDPTPPCSPRSACKLG